MTEGAKPKSFLFAAAVMLTAIMLFNVMGAIIKHLGSSYPAQQLSMLRNFFGFFPTLVILWMSSGWVKAGKPVVIRQWKFGLFRGGVVAFAQFCFYFSITKLEFATATSITFAGPLFITALSIPILGHRVGVARWGAVLIGFLGVLLVMRPDGESFNLYVILPFCAAFAYATLSISARLFDDDVPTALMNIYSNVGALVGSGLLVVFTQGWVSVQTFQDWFWIIAMGSAGGIAAFCIITAYRLADPSSLSPFEYFGIPFSFILGWYFFQEAPFDRLMPGVLLIVGGGLIIVWRERKLRRN